jgi:hypothetical protein
LAQLQPQLPAHASDSGARAHHLKAFLPHDIALLNDAEKIICLNPFSAKKIYVGK